MRFSSDVRQTALRNLKAFLGDMISWDTTSVADGRYIVRIVAFG